MDYVQLTLDDWMELKQKIKKELVSVKKSFVRIGYALHKIRDEKLYERDGYKTMGEFAEKEYGLKPSTVSRLIEINAKFSIGGNSEELAPEYENFGKYQLEEMLQLPESDYEMVQPAASRETIRELKRFNAAEAAPEDGGFKDLVKDFLEKTGVLEDLDKTKTTKQLAEIVNPSGNRSYRKGKFFVMMYESELKVKQAGAGIEEMSWERFFEIVWEVAEEIAPAQKALNIQGPENISAIPEKAEEIPEEPKVETPPERERIPENRERLAEKVEFTPTKVEKVDTIPQKSEQKPENRERLEEKAEEAPEVIVEPMPEPVMPEPEKAPEALENPDIQKYLAEMEKEYIAAMQEAREGHWNAWKAHHNAAEEFAKLLQQSEAEDENQMSIDDYPGIIPEEEEYE